MQCCPHRLTQSLAAAKYSNHMNWKESHCTCSVLIIILSGKFRRRSFYLTTVNHHHAKGMLQQKSLGIDKQCYNNQEHRDITDRKDRDDTHALVADTPSLRAC